MVSGFVTLATVTAGAEVRKNLGKDGMVQLYNFASARVGNSEFKEAFEHFIPYTFRIVNLADIVPVYPPTEIPLKKVTYKYTHVGEQWSFLYQTGNILTNHLCEVTYIEAVENEIPTNKQLNYPTNCIDDEKEVDA